MTGRETAEADEQDRLVGGALAVLFVLLVVFVLAFVYKVWNERKWRMEAHEQAAQTKRIADTFEFFAEEAQAAEARKTVKQVELGPNGRFVTTPRGTPKWVLVPDGNHYH